MLPQIATRLAERRVHVEMEVMKFGEAPAGIKEVFELCRGFERAYVHYVNVSRTFPKELQHCNTATAQGCVCPWMQESPVASKVKESFLGDDGLAGVIKKLPLEKTFELGNVKQVCTVGSFRVLAPDPVNACGTPRTGLPMCRRVSSPPDVSGEGHACPGSRSDGPIAQTRCGVCPAGLRPPLERGQVSRSRVHRRRLPFFRFACVVCREAAEKAGQFTESALKGSMPMYVPDFKNVCMPAIVAAMDEWKQEANRSESDSWDSHPGSPVARPVARPVAIATTSPRATSQCL